MYRILVLYYSTHGHVESLANEVASGAREASGDVTVKRVPELNICGDDQLRRGCGAGGSRLQPTGSAV